MLNITDKNLLDRISDFSSIPVGASYNIRKNGAGIERSTNERVLSPTKPTSPALTSQSYPTQRVKRYISP